MNVIFRVLLFPIETLIYGISYGTIQFLIRSKRPLDPEKTWKLITRDPPGLIKWFRSHYPPGFMRPLLLAAKLKQDHVVGISKHYDVSNEFYELFLDEKYMFYSCADFYPDTETLEEAQTNKADFILNLIDPQPGEKILELGCGWGSMMKRICEVTGDKENLSGYTLSKEQVAYNQQHNGFNVEFKNFITADYPDSHYDKIYSIGAWEHVRPTDIGPLSKKLYAALRPGGKLVKHFFCRGTDRLYASIAVSQIFFPGSVGSSYRAHVDAFEGAGFHILRRSIHDYRPTLRAWFDNLVANRDKAIELVGVRTYNRYLVFFPASWRYFQECYGMLVRWEMVKPRKDSN